MLTVILLSIVMPFFKPSYLLPDFLQNISTKSKKQNKTPIFTEGRLLNIFVWQRQHSKSVLEFITIVIVNLVPAKVVPKLELS
jgi:hypothetical protein